MRGTSIIEKISLITQGCYHNKERATPLNMVCALGLAKKTPQTSSFDESPALLLDCALKTFDEDKSK
jgi:hypothetical protein